MPALSTARTAYTYAMPACTPSRNDGSTIGTGVIGCSVSAGSTPRSTMYPARSFSAFGSQMRLIAPSPEIALSSFGAAGGNVSTSVSHAAGDDSLSIVASPIFSAETMV